MGRLKSVPDYRQHARTRGAHMRNRLVTFGMLLTLILAISGEALADAPVFMERFDDRFVDEDLFLAETCGLSTVLVEGRVHGVFKEYADGRRWENAVGTIKLTGPSGEGPVFVTFALPFESVQVSESLDETTGLLTQVFQETSWGSHQKIRIPGRGVLVMDRGFISWTVTVVIDTTVDPEVEDPVVSIGFTDVVMHGPHPLFENDFSPTSEQFAVICEALGGG